MVRLNIFLNFAQYHQTINTIPFSISSQIKNICIRDLNGRYIRAISLDDDTFKVGDIVKVMKLSKKKLEGKLLVIEDDYIDIRVDNNTCTRIWNPSSISKYYKIKESVHIDPVNLIGDMGSVKWSPEYNLNLINKDLNLINKELNLTDKDLNLNDKELSLELYGIIAGLESDLLFDESESVELIFNTINIIEQESSSVNMELSRSMTEKIINKENLKYNIILQPNIIQNGSRFLLGKINIIDSIEKIFISLNDNKILSGYEIKLDTKIPSGLVKIYDDDNLVGQNKIDSTKKILNDNSYSLFIKIFDDPNVYTNILYESYQNDNENVIHQFVKISGNIYSKYKINKSSVINYEYYGKIHKHQINIPSNVVYLQNEIIWKFELLPGKNYIEINIEILK